MSNSQEQPWSNNPNAPVIPRVVYIGEKANFAGTLVSSILYGILVVLSFECTTALFNSVHRRGEPIKWGLVSYTVVMFSLVTAGTGMNLDILSISYIDNRDFPGIEGVLRPGPYGYQAFISAEAINMIPTAILVLSNWLADGFLLYRCYNVYSMNFWVVVFPCLVYLGSFAMGILFIYQNTVLTSSIQWSAVPYFSISLSLNVLLTLMIVIRLILHTRNTRTALGITGIGGLCKAIIAMLIESCALYAVSSLLVIGPWSTENPVTNAFFPILSQIQVIAPLLIIQRVANKSALTSNTVASGHLSEFQAESQGMSTGGSGALAGVGLTSSVDEHGTNSDERAVGVETTIDFHQDKA